MGNNSVIEELDRLDPDKVFKELMTFTLARLSSIRWMSGKESGPMGKEASDFTMTALTYAMQNSEKWRQEHSLISWLRWLVNKEVSNSLTSSENKMASNIDLDENFISSYSSFVASLYTDLSDHLIDYDKRLKAFQKKIKSMVKDDEDYIEFVFEEMVKGYSPESISQNLDIEINKIYNYIRRIKTALKSL